ncbi:MAG: long-chain fatty acid--CoA ligase [Gammaproteobacteria bacterium]|nr:long-chain fatty acid--CoA ligase [Gammaproteobacteria bacterium]
MTTSALLEALRTMAPDRIALDDGRQRITFGQVAALVEAEGEWLARRGERFALLADNGIGWAIADLALHLRALPSVPVPGYFTAPQVQHVLDDAGIDCVLTDDAGRVRELLAGWRVEGAAARTGLTMFRRQLDPASRATLPAGTVKVTYTSGSTAAPKGVCLGADDLETIAKSLAGATSGLGVQRHLCLLPLATLLENVGGIYAPLLAGACSVIPSSRVSGMSYAGPDVSRLLACVLEARPESLILVPELLRLLVVAAERGWSLPRSLKFVAVGGAPVAVELLERAAAVGLPVYEGYGLSECASVVCLNTPEARRVGSVGRPLPHARVRVAEDGQLMVSGVTMRGYLGESPRQPDDEWPTGDLGEIDADGYVYVRGRLRNMYITSYGRNVAPEWVEREIALEPGIRHVMVHGEGRPYAVALVSAPHEGADAATIERAIRSANARLPDYAQVRRWVRAPETFSFDNGLLTSNGRLRRRDIVQRHGALLDALYREEIAS